MASRNFDIATLRNPNADLSLNLSTVRQTLAAAAGVAFADGEIGYLAADGMRLADASAEATAKGTLYMADGAISAGGTGNFIVVGQWTTTGLTKGTEYYLSETAGAFTSVRPSTSGAIVRVIGTALSTTTLLFQPYITYVEV